jgi:HAMP domain-containing protein
MRIGTKIMLSHLVMLTTVALVCLAIVVALAFTKDDRRQLHTSYEQLRNMNLVAADANRYSEQIAELFILGGQEADILDARGMLLSRLRRQRELIEEEHVLAGQPNATWGGLDRVAEMESKVRQIDVARLEIQAHLAADRRTDAERVFREDIEHSLDRTFGQLIEEAIQRERDEVEGALESSARLSEQSIWLAVALVGIVATLGIANVVILNRTILRPISALHAGAEAVGRGELQHRVRNGSPDELGDLAHSFNEMTAQIGKQRDSLLEAKSTLSEQVEERTRELREQSEALAETNARLRAVDARSAPRATRP